MVNVAAIVDRALRTAGIPIDGVSIGDPANRATWTIQFQPAATAPQRATAATLLTTVAVDAAAQAVQDHLDAQAFIDAIPLWEQACFLLVLDQVNLIRSKLVPPLGAISVPVFLQAIKDKVATL